MSAIDVAAVLGAALGVAGGFAVGWWARGRAMPRTRELVADRVAARVVDAVNEPQRVTPWPWHESPSPRLDDTPALGTRKRVSARAARRTL